VAHAVDAVREQSGRVDVLIHAAGIEISRLLPDKEPAEFERVFDVKVNGWFNLLKAIGHMPLGAAVVFSSIAGRFGNGGQTDYSAANDLLCKSVSNFRRTRPDTRGIAIDWTAWSGIGMASRGSIPKVMEAAGIDMLPPEAGVPIVRRELTEGSTSGEVVIADRLGMMLEEFDPVGIDRVSMAVNDAVQGSGPMIGRIERVTPTGGLVVETTLDPRIQPFLFDHQIDGTPVLPGVMGVEAFSELASVLLPEYHVVAVEDVHFRAAFKFFRQEPRTLRMHALLTPSEDTVVADCRLVGVRMLPGHAEPQETVHFTARVRLSRDPLRAEQGQPPIQTVEHRVLAPDIYRVYFHGPAYQVLGSAWHHEGLTIGRLARGLPPAHHPPDRPTLMSPRLLELCFQTASLCELGAKGVLALPLQVDCVTTYRPEPPDDPVFAVVRRDPDGQAFDADVVDRDGQLYLRLRGYRTVEVPGTFDQGLLAPLRLGLATAVTSHGVPSAAAK
jgi:hypothetical protein